MRIQRINKHDMPVKSMSLQQILKHTDLIVSKKPKEMKIKKIKMTEKHLEFVRNSKV